jgi:hypothetical protein
MLDRTDRDNAAGIERIRPGTFAGTEAGTLLDLTKSASGCVPHWKNATVRTIRAIPGDETRKTS